MADRKRKQQPETECLAGNAAAGNKQTLQKLQDAEEFLQMRPVRTNRQHKDALFRIIFKDKKNALSLYNAVNGSHYDDPDQLTVTTLENTLYMSVKNDVSFIVDGSLSLYEHQSTANPNMPLRSLLYVASVYGALVNWDDLYRKKCVRIAEPRFVTFYNGTDEMPERLTLKLSDAYETHTDAPTPCAERQYAGVSAPYGAYRKPMLELEVLVLNINKGYNKELMENCWVLRDYAAFVSKVRENRATMETEEAVARAIEDCIRENVLVDILRKNRNEVLGVILEEYDFDRHMEIVREEALEEAWEKAYNSGQKDGYSSGQKDGYNSGQKDGYARILRLVDLMSKAGEADKIPNLSEDEAFLEEMCKKYNV